MDTNLQDISWQKEFIEIKASKPEIIRLLLVEAKGRLNEWRLGRLHAEYEQNKERQK